MSYYTLKFQPGTISEIRGSKSDIIAELYNLIDELESIADDENDVSKTVPLYDMDGTDYIAASITE